MPKTGEKCETSGIYQCAEHTAHQITMPKGHTFPPCDASGDRKDHGATWKIVVKTRH